MKAILVTKYGGPEVLKLKEVPIPSKKENEILIKIHAAAVNNTDPVFRKGKPFISRIFTGLTRPKHAIPGDVFAGKIVEIGNKVTNFKIGDKIYGYTTNALGAHAEYICLPDNSPIAIIPDNISYKEAAGIVDGGHTALVFLRDKGEINYNKKVLIYGASGSIGTAAIQLSIHFNAEVSGVCSGSNIKLIKSLGVKNAIDYTKTDFTQENKKYDIIFDTVAKKSFSQCKNVLTENGIYLTTFPSLSILLKGLFQTKGKGKRAFFVATGMKPAKEKAENLQYISELLKDQKIKAVISKSYSMDDIAKAHKYVETGHKVGNAIINV